MCGDEHLAARIDVEGAAVNAARIDMLDRAGLAALRVDRNTASVFSPPAKTPSRVSSTVLEARLAT